MATLSAHTDEATASRVGEMARLEDRTPSQITAAAVRWYVRLSAAARDALRRIEAQGDQAIDEAAWAAGRAVLDKEYEAVLDRGLANYTPTLPANASEDEILAEAVRITRRR
jgi:predicted transcriptional regulator